MPATARRWKPRSPATSGAPSPDQPPPAGRRGPGRPGGAHRPRPWRRSPSPPCCAARSVFPPAPGGADVLRCRLNPAPEFSRPLPLGLVGPEGRREVAGGRRSGARGARPPLRHPRRRELPGRAAPAAGRGWRPCAPKAACRAAVVQTCVVTLEPVAQHDRRGGGAPLPAARARAAGRAGRDGRDREPGTASPTSARRWRNSSPSRSTPILARPMRSCPRTPSRPPPPSIPWRRWPSSAAAGVIEGRRRLPGRRRRW